MRLIYLGAFRLPDGDAASSRVINVARSLRLAGHDVSFISWGGVQNKDNYCFDGVYRVDGFPFCVTNEIDIKGGFREKALGKLFQGRKTKRLLLQRVGMYDAIICYNCALLNWLRHFCRVHSIVLICDLTEWYSYCEQKPYEWFGNFINMHFVQKKIKNKIVISKYLDSYYSDSHNLIIPATGDVTDKKWLGRETSSTSLLKGFNGITLIYAGTPAKKDSLSSVVESVQRLLEEGANLRFLILGVSRDDYIRTNGCSLSPESCKQILFLGRVSQEEVPSFYRLADFMVLLRKQTRKSNAGFPTKFTESMISGTPVIANLTSDLGLYLKDGETGFIVNEPTAEALCHIIKERVLPLNSTQIRAMKDNVRKISKKLDYHAFVEPISVFMNDLN